MGVDRDVIGSTATYTNWNDCMSTEEDARVCCKDNEIRGFSISGEDPSAPWFSLGENTGFDLISEELDSTSMYTFTDTDVTNGFEYTYSVTAYDMGVSGANPQPGMIDVDGELVWDGTMDTLYVANPEQWASPDGYQSIENSKGTTVYDLNFVMATPGYGAVNENDLSNIKVVPNPFVVWSGFEEYDYMRIMSFTHLPEKCTITIFTINGEKVIKLEHDSSSSGTDTGSGTLEWNARTVNNQEIAPGLYIYAVETPGGEKHIGKFAVIR